MFGDGHLASCKPISEADLASFMADCIEDKQKINQVLPIGGAWTCPLLNALPLCRNRMFYHQTFAVHLQPCTSGHAAHIA